MLALSVRAEEFEVVRAYLSSLVSCRLTALQTNKDGQQQKCSGMYSESSWGGTVKPYILTKFDNFTLAAEANAIISFVIFEWHDVDLLGVYGDPDDLQVRASNTIWYNRRVLTRENDQKEALCYEENATKGYCNSSQIGEFILQKNASILAHNKIVTKAITLKNSEPIEYPITQTGYYCVWTYDFNGNEYRAVVEFRNAYGELPGAQIPKLAFFGGLTIVYAVIGA